MASLTALVVGVGALGNEVAKYLALLGARKIWLLDRDRVEASNLTRSVLFCFPDIQEHLRAGTPKAEVAARRVREINPDVSATAFVGEVGDLGLGILRRADLIFCCVDNEAARAVLSRACLRLGKLLVDGGLGLINYSGGLVSIFPGADGPCYVCRKGQTRRRELLQELFGTEDPCWVKEKRQEERGIVPTTPLMASIIGALQVEVGLRRFFSAVPGTEGTSYRLVLNPVPELQVIEFSRSPNCPLHEPEDRISGLETLKQGCSQEITPRLLFEQVSLSSYLTLDWPLTVGACCRSCGYSWRPFLRRARMRHESCPGCGSVDIAETSTLSEIESGSPWQDYTLAELGFPRSQIHQLVVRSQDGSRPHYVEIGDSFEEGQAIKLCS